MRDGGIMNGAPTPGAFKMNGGKKIVIPNLVRELYQDARKRRA
jgi:hypothetical protein